MTAPRRHSANDGSFGRSAGDAATRGAMLIGLAVLIGLLLLWKGFDDSGNAVASSGGDGTTVSDGGGTDAASGDGTTTGGETDGTAGGDGDATAGGDGTDENTDAVPTTTAPATVDCSAVGGDITHAPNDVQVIAANGTGAAGLATSMANQLGALNYVATGKNATNAPVATSRILYRQCHSLDAQAIAQAIGAVTVTPELLSGPPPVDPSGDQAIVDSASVFVIMGSDGVVAPS